MRLKKCERHGVSLVSSSFWMTWDISQMKPWYSQGGMRLHSLHPGWWHACWALVGPTWWRKEKKGADRKPSAPNRGHMQSICQPSFWLWISSFQSLPRQNAWRATSNELGRCKAIQVSQVKLNPNTRNWLQAAQHEREIQKVPQAEAWGQLKIVRKKSANFPETPHVV